MTERTAPAGGAGRGGGRSGTALFPSAAGAEVMDVLVDRGHIADIDRHFGSLVASLDDTTRASLALAAALASAWTRDGHACIALPEVAGRDWPGPGGLRLPELDAWIDALDASAMVTRPGDTERRPLVLDGRGRLYLERLWTAERTVADGLLGLAAGASPAPLETDVPPAPRSGLPEQRGDGEGAFGRVGPGRGDLDAQGPGDMSGGSVLGAGGLDAALDRLFPGAAPHDRARVAARTAACRRLCVVSGGPGTGKTTIAAAIVALLVELGIAAPDRIALAAPTGKAAARLQEAVRGRHRDMVSRIPALERYEARATTVHRWLRARSRSAAPVDALVLDESSMVDLTLMARVLAALPAAARLVLLGDASQLASVQPGAVFADVCRAGRGVGAFPAGDETPTPAAAKAGAGSGEGESAGPGVAEGEVDSPGARATREPGAGGGSGAREGGTGPRGGDAGRHETGGAEASDSSPLAACVVELVRNWRFDAAGGIGRLAAAVVRGDGVAAVAALRDSADAATELRPLADARQFERLATTFADERFAPALRAMQSMPAFLEPDGRAASLSAFRALCAHRIGAFGAERFNRLVERRLGSLGLVPANDAFFPGRPILVTRNDPRTGLSNGDTGIVVRDADHRVGVWFPELEDADGRPRVVSPARLPPHESFFAVTVHRAQGSEYDEVAVVVGPAESRVATRELLYTAVTRARRRVTVYGSEESVVVAVGRTTERFSGLRDAFGRSGAAAAPA